MTKVHVQARRYAAEGYTIVLIGHAGHEEVVGTMGEAPESTVLVQSVEEAEQLAMPAGAKLAYTTQTTLSVDETARDHRRAAPPLPGHPRAAPRGHLLRDLQPAVGGQGAAAARGRPARDRLAQLLELEPPRRGRARGRRAGVPHRRRDRHRRALARRRAHGRPHLGGLGAREARRARVRLVPRPRRDPHRAVPAGRRGRDLPPPGRAAPRARARRNAGGEGAPR